MAVVGHVSIHLDDAVTLAVNVVDTSAWVNIGGHLFTTSVFVRDIATADKMAHIFGALADSMRERDGKLFSLAESDSENGL